MKLSLFFHSDPRTREVHTIRSGGEHWDGGYATCGKVIFKGGEVSREPIQITCPKCLDAYTKRFTWTVQFTVHPTWVADGFDLTDERALEMLHNDLAYANEDELEAKIISAPDPDEVAMEQGYRDDADRKDREG